MNLKARKIWDISLYISVMTLASGFSLARGFFVAGLLDLSSFGLYATIVAMGMFFASLVSFGEIERTIKAFPRLWIECRYNEVIKRTDRSVKKLFGRVLLLTSLLLVCILLDRLAYESEIGLLVIFVALNSATASLYASAIRATGGVDILARNALFRSVIVLTFGLLGAFYFSWKGAILGEAFGYQLGSLVTRFSLKRKIKLEARNTDNFERSKQAMLAPDGKLWLFFGALFLAVPTFLDRAFVSLVYDKPTVGTLGFLMLFVTAASTLTGIIAQQAGPQLVKMQHIGERISFQLRYGSRWLLLIWTVLVIGMTITLLVLIYGPARYFFDKFHLDLSLLAATAALCMLQVSVIADFIIISRNKEQAVFFSACCYLLVIGCMAAVVYWSKPPLADFIWLLAFCKGIHVVAQSGVICKLWYRENRQWGGVR
jgi:hypothetical protein